MRQWWQRATHPVVDVVMAVAIAIGEVSLVQLPVTAVGFEVRRGRETSAGGNVSAKVVVDSAAAVECRN